MLCWTPRSFICKIVFKPLWFPGSFLALTFPYVDISSGGPFGSPFLPFYSLSREKAGLLYLLPILIQSFTSVPFFLHYPSAYQLSRSFGYPFRHPILGPCFGVYFVAWHFSTYIIIVHKPKVFLYSYTLVSHFFYFMFWFYFLLMPDFPAIFSAFIFPINPFLFSALFHPSLSIAPIG